MCGIAGIVGMQGRPVDLDALQRMTDLQTHRGPDGQGFVVAWGGPEGFCSTFLQHTRQWSGQGQIPVRVGLGHRRLAILDLSDRGLQPMTIGGSGAWIVFNGEIYNHRELRHELEADGQPFTTRTDTEVLLAAYLRWGEACLQHVQGMFAFAIWDGMRGRLFAARDRLGIKPFYFATTPAGNFTFASEMKALLAVPGVEPVPDDDAVLGFLIHGNCDYGGRTTLRQVAALPAGHALLLDLGKRRLDTWRYWEPRPQAPWNGAGPKVDDLRDLLVRTTRAHLLSDVRVGSCLSGGLDSSVIVALVGKLRREEPDAAAAVGDSIYTFTACYEDPEIDERQYALEVASSVGATPHLVFPTPQDFWDSFVAMAWHHDMPFSGLSIYAQWRVMRAAREAGVKVLLDGQGGDEVFGGYAKFRYAYLASLLRGGHPLRLAREFGAMLLQRDPYLLDVRRGYRYLPSRLRQVLGIDTLLRDVLRADWSRAFADESTPAGRWWRRAAGVHERGSPWTVMQSIQIEDLLMDTLPLLLRLEDRSSMAFSLEARVPLLDHTVVEYGLSLPDDLKIHHGWSKFAMREAARGLMPEDVRRRRTKLGFAAPDRVWLANDLRPQITELLDSDLRCERFVDPAALRRWYHSSDAAGATTESYLSLFRVLSLEMWMRAFGVR